ncbi:MAG: hypothetical protein AAF740_08330 [Bacteroidota bacterium]
MKTISSFSVLLLVLCFLSACSSSSSTNEESQVETTTTAESNTSSVTPPQSDEKSSQVSTKYDGIYGRSGQSANEFYIFKNGYMKGYRLTTDAGERVHELLFKYVYPRSSQDVVKLEGNKFSYLRDRYTGEFLMEGDNVVGLREGYSEFEKIDNLEKLLTVRALNKSNLTAYLSDEEGLSEVQIEELLTKTPFIEFIEVEEDENFSIQEVIKRML